MTFKIASRVWQTSATTGTGTLSFDASSNPTGYRKFVDAIGNANTCPYVIDDGQGNWEEGIGTVTSGTPDTLARTTVINNSLGTTAKINFAAGTKTVQITPVGSRAWWWNSVPTTDQIGIANSAGGMDPISIAAYFKKLLTTDGDVAQNVSGTVQRQTVAAMIKTLLTTDGDVAQNVSGTVQRQTVAAMIKTLLTTDGDVALNDSGTVVRSSVSGALKKLLTTDGDVAQNVGGTVSNRTPAQLVAKLPIPAFRNGLTLSTSGSSSTFGIAAGSATDSTGTANMVLASAYTKTTSAWALGSGNGSLDIGTIASNTWYYPYEIERPDTGVTDVLTSLAPGKSATVTISQASPGVVTWADHGLQANAPVVFTTTGSLPTGLTAGTQYFVKTVSTTSTFTVSATQGGTAINTSSAGSGTHTATSNPVLPSNYTLFRRLGAMKTDGSSKWLIFTQIGNRFIQGASTNDINTSAQGTTAILYPLTVPPGFKVEALVRGIAAQSSQIVVVLINSPDETAVAANAAVGAVTVQSPAAAVGASFVSSIFTNASQQVRAVANAASTTVFLATYGWVDLTL